MPHRYLPHTPEDIRKMLDVIGAPSIDSLLGDIPEALLAGAALDLPEGLDEHSLKAHLLQLASRQAVPDTDGMFLGGGAYNHFQPGVHL